MFWLNQRKAVRDAKSACATILLFKTYKNNSGLCYYLPCSLKISSNAFALLHVRVNLGKSVRKYHFPYSSAILALTETIELRSQT